MRASLVILALAMAPGVVRADLFSDPQPLALALSAPFRAVFAKRAKPLYQDAELKFRGANGAETSVPLRIRQRGKSRAQVCTFPPLLLNFRKSDLVSTPFEGEDRLKLVTHCKPGSEYDQYLLLEYLGYRVYGLLTDMSLRVRQVEMTYVDNGRNPVKHRALLLEDEQRFGERKSVKVFEGPAVDRTRYDPAALALVDVFEYFMGNTDWSSTAAPPGATCCHNVVPYVREDGRMVPVPYDFDATGLVNAPYAKPDARLKIRTVRQRLYRGHCRSMAELEPAFARFRERRADILALFDRSSGLTANVAAGARAYVEQFYAVLEDPQRRDAEFMINCAR